MSTTIPESEYQDCVEELSAKLSAERKLNSDKNTRIAELEEQIGKQIDFIMAFEAFLSSELGDRVGYTDTRNRGEYIYLESIMEECNELKAQHLDDGKGE